MRLRFSRVTGLAAVAAAVILVAAGCGSGGDAVGALKARPPIVIGISLSLTGSFSADGNAYNRGYHLWQADINSHGGILGRQVKLIVLNDNSSTTKVVTNYDTLVSKDHVALTFGPFSSLLSIPASEALGKLGYALICGACGAQGVFADAKGDEKYHNVFDPSLPVADYMQPLITYIKSLPVSERPKTAAYPTANDPFAGPAVATAQQEFQKLGIKTVYSKSFNETPADYRVPALQAAASGAEMVVLGSTAVPTVVAFMKAFEQAHANPKVFIAFSGPDQGQSFLGAVGKANATGMMVPDGWYGDYANPLNNYMVEQYIARYGGTSTDINADVAEAFSVGEVAADAITATGGTNNSKIMKYLHSGVTLQTVQGPARFNRLGENPVSVAFISQWQPQGFVQVLPIGTAGASPIKYPKPPWGSLQNRHQEFARRPRRVRGPVRARRRRADDDRGSGHGQPGEGQPAIGHRSRVGRRSRRPVGRRPGDDRRPGLSSCRQELSSRPGGCRPADCRPGQNGSLVSRRSVIGRRSVVSGRSGC